MCDSLNPSQPVTGMGEIKFPENGKPGSGDVVEPIGKKKRRRVYKEKPAKTILSFAGFLERKRSTQEQKNNSELNR